MKNKKTLFSIIVIIATIFTLTCCKGGDKLNGAYIDNQGTSITFSDNKLTISGGGNIYDEGIFEIKDEQFHYIGKKWEIGPTKYSLKGNILTIDEIGVLTKKSAKKTNKDSSVDTLEAYSDILNSLQNLVIWSFTDELANMINNPTYGFKTTHPDIEVEYSQTPSHMFQARLDPALASGEGAPDVFALEAAFVRKYVESGLLLDITDIYNDNKAKLLTYPVEIGTYQGKVYAMSWQAAPGAMFYRRSLAKKYLGTDDPNVVQTYFTDFNKFLETAQLLKSKSNGTCVVVSTLGDLKYPFLYARKDPWIVNGKVVVDPAMEQYLDICKTLFDNSLAGRVGQWSEGWYAGMRGELKDKTRRRVEVFSYFLPTWGLPYVLKSNAPGTSGDWAMIKGPSSYRWGGTWVGAYKDTKKKRNAKEFIRYVATDENFLENWAKDTGDIVSNINTINKIKDSYSEPYLGGQNHYAEFAEIAKSVNGRLAQGSDEAIEALFDEAAAAYWNNEKTKAQALADFKAQAEAQFGGQ